MLKPIETLSNIASQHDWDAETLDRKRESLLQEILNPNSHQMSRTSVLGVYAHGDEALRVAFYPHVGPGEVAAHYAVQTWSIDSDSWITQKSYFIQETNARHAAIDDAKNWYPVLDGQEVLLKWAKALDTQSDPSELFTNRAEFAEFWYDVKDASWSSRYEDQPSAWDYDLACAETLFMYNGHAQDAPGGWDPSDIEIALTNMMSEWGEIPRPVFTGSLRDPLTDNFTAFVQYASPEEALTNIRESGENARLRATILMDMKTPQSYKLFLYNKSVHDEMPSDTLLSSMHQFLEAAENSYHSKMNNNVEITPAVLTTTHFDIESDITDSECKELGVEYERNYRIEAWAFGTTTLKSHNFSVEFNWKADADQSSSFSDPQYDIEPADDFEYSLKGVKLVSLDGSHLNQDLVKQAVLNLVSAVDWRASVQHQLAPPKPAESKEYDSHDLQL